MLPSCGRLWYWQQVTCDVQCTGLCSPSCCRTAAVFYRCTPLPAYPAVQSTFTTPLGRAVYSFFFDAKQRGMGVPVHELFLPK